MKPSRNKKASNSENLVPGNKNAKKISLSRFKEEVEQKKKNDTVDAAKVYADFVASFEDPEDDLIPQMASSAAAPRGFVRGKPLIPSSYIPEKITSELGLEKNPSDNHQMNSSIPNNLDKAAVSKNYSVSSKKPRMIEEFMAELKQQQEERDGKLKQIQYLLPGVSFPKQDGSILLRPTLEDRVTLNELGDPTSTNLYLGNISPKVNEEILCQTFGKFGPIASVKIMWPRNQEEIQRERNCGFVSFMDRMSAVAALNAMDGHSLHGQALRVSWGKPVTIPAEPFFDINAKPVLVRTGLPFNARLKAYNLPTTSQQKVGSYKFVPPPEEASESQLKPKTRLEVLVSEPKDPQVLKVIHRMVERVCLHGFQFEALIMQREIGNKKFQFLFDFATPEHIYYRWKLFSLLQGDSKTSWRTDPFKMFDEGPYFLPPPIPSEGSHPSLKRQRSNSVSSSDNLLGGTKDNLVSANSKKMSQTHSELKQLLENLTTDRKSIGFAMVAFLERVGESEEVANLIEDNFCSQTLEPSAAIANVYLLSDILHNVNPELPQSWRLRAEIEKRLVKIFTQLNLVYKGIGARLRAETFRRTLSNVFTIWETSLLFPAPFLHSLSNVFHHGTLVDSEDLPASVPLEFPTNTSLLLEAPPVEKLHENVSPDDYDDIDGLPLQEPEVVVSSIQEDYDDVDGIPIDTQNTEASEDDMFD